jgi:general secretion pathway protein L
MTALLNNFNDTLIGLKKQILANRFLRWWLSELSTMVPGWIRSSDLTFEHYVLVPLEHVNSHMNKPEVLSPRVAAITLSASQILRRTVTLPLATEESLRQVLEFQMDQLTPFPCDKVYFGYTVLTRDFDAGQLTVEFVATPRDSVDLAIKTMLGLGVDVRAVFVDQLISTDTVLNLLPAALGGAPSPLRHGANPWLLALVVLLALAAIAVPLVIKREAVVQLLPAVEKAKKAAEIVTAKRNELDLMVKQHNYVLEKRQMTPPVIRILEELTHILPDDTWVNVFDLKDKKLQIQGETGSSPKLIGLFEKSDVFQDASFSSGLFKGQAPNTERYQLTVLLRPPAMSASTPATPLSSPATSASIASAPSTQDPAKASSSTAQPVGGRTP